MNALKSNKIEKIISNILEKYNINSLPIDVTKIAEHLKIEIKIRPYQGNESLSGILVRESNNTVIGVNALHPEERQRFTIAHELGHYLLHDGEQLFIDKSYKVNFRYSTSVDGNDAKEIEANHFAGVLLIPTRFLLEDLNKEPIDFLDETHIKKLAKKYNVSEQAMSIRLAKL